MGYKLLADLVVIVHFVFILFAVFGALLLLRSKRLAWLHLPCLAWAVLVEFTGWRCPLTPLENLLRTKAGTSIYHTGFIDHYIVGLIYPAALTRKMQMVLGGLLLAFNLCVYGWVIKGALRGKKYDI